MAHGNHETSSAGKSSAAERKGSVFWDGLSKERSAASIFDGSQCPSSLLKVITGFHRNNNSHGHLHKSNAALSKTSLTSRFVAGSITWKPAESYNGFVLTLPISRFSPSLGFPLYPSLRDTCGTYIANECSIPRKYPTNLCSARTLTAAVKSIKGQDE